VVVVHVIWHLGIGGGEVFLRGLTSALSRRGLEQHVFTVGPAGVLAKDVEAGGVPVTAFEKSSRAGLMTIWRLARAIGRLRPSVVHTHGEAGAFWGLPAARLASAPAVSLIYQNHDETAVKMRLQRAVLGLPRIVVAGSRDVARFARERLGVPDSRLRTVYCGIAMRTPAGPTAPRASDRRTPTFITVGRLIDRKGHGPLIDAFAIVRGRVPDARLIIVGDGPARGALERRAVRRGVDAATTFAGTVYPTADLLSDADVFVFPSLVEPQGLALLEAFAAGTPVIATRTGGIPEMLHDGIDGLLVEPGDVAGLASAMLRMLTDPGLRASFAAHARLRLPAFDVETIAGEYVALYRAAAGTPAAR
jgi:glycosyltransferase involved in cell wall biosynthesis